MEKEDFKLQEGRSDRNFLHIQTQRLVLQSNYDLLFYKTYGRNSSEYYFEKEEGNQLTEANSSLWV